MSCIGKGGGIRARPVTPYLSYSYSSMERERRAKMRRGMGENKTRKKKGSAGCIVLTVYPKKKCEKNGGCSFEGAHFGERKELASHAISTISPLVSTNLPLPPYILHWYLQTNTFPTEGGLETLYLPQLWSCCAALHTWYLIYFVEPTDSG